MHFYVLNKYTDMKSTWLLCFIHLLRGGGVALCFTTMTFYGKNPQFGGNYDFIFLPTKSAAVGLFMNITFN